MKYEKHLFVCTNDKEGKKCCGSEQGMQLVEAFKEKIKSNGLQQKYRAQRAGCFDTCGKGPSIVIYPEGTFYGNVQLNDVDEIFESHIQNDQIIERLKLDF